MKRSWLGQGAEVQKNIFQIALAGLISNPGLIRGWEADLSNKLGKLPNGFSEIVELASKLSAGAPGSTDGIDKLESIFDNVSLSDGSRQATDLHFYTSVPFSLQKDLIFPLDSSSKCNRRIEEYFKR